MGTKKRQSSPKRAAFIAELATNGGNLSKAAKAVGYHPQHGRRLAADPDVQAALSQAKETVNRQLVEWGEMQSDARRKLYELMNGAEDERVQLLAAKEIIERNEGKTTAKVEHSGEVRTKIIQDEGTIMAIMTLMGRRRWTLAQAFAYVKAHPQEVQEWMRSLPSGDEEPAAIEEAEYEILEPEQA